ncbi:8-amino-7-oxononanoate synthase [Tumebacillus sp. BK434]|uniref:8-amino-7-oxononanoate synthase n=1 Tax=Tumebacillus sp. BK434 TaxID=2512169 RepID=UPI0010446854|nr:8-amino-7-oxononanoate synthase [Tumebacillus sp. BK434]TCP53825.1 8-amino-7-oxononanoate synthase [Tumebacillus sp. BK434]
MDFKQELEQLQAQGLQRRLRRMDSAASRTVTVEGRTLLMCASNNYLGLADDPRLAQAAIDAVREYGTGSSGSRLTTGNTALHERLEAELAAFKGTEAALLFNTGYMANLAALSALTGAGDLILSDRLNHASLIDGARLSRAEVQIYEHGDLDDLERKLAVARNKHRRVLIATDGVFSMEGDIAPLPGICDLAEAYGAEVLVDDAHATGVLGANGAGTVDHFGLRGRVAVQMGTLSKALGAEGGYLAGSRSLIDFLLNRARPFIFSTAQSPAVIGAALQALQLVRQEPERRQHVRQLADRLRSALRQAGFRVLPGETPILGVVIGEAEAAVRFARRLEAAGIFAPAIRPPTVPAGTSRIRLTLTARHTEADCAAILSAFHQARAEERKELLSCQSLSPRPTPGSEKL